MTKPYVYPANAWPAGAQRPQPASPYTGPYASAYANPAAGAAWPQPAASPTASQPGQFPFPAQPWPQQSGPQSFGPAPRPSQQRVPAVPLAPLADTPGEWAAGALHNPGAALRDVGNRISASSFGQRAFSFPTYQALGQIAQALAPEGSIGNRLGRAAEKLSAAPAAQSAMLQATGDPGAAKPAGAAMAGWNAPAPHGLSDLAASWGAAPAVSAPASTLGDKLNQAAPSVPASAFEPLAAKAGSAPAAQSAPMHAGVPAVPVANLWPSKEPSTAPSVAPADGNPWPLRPETRAAHAAAPISPPAEDYYGQQTRVAYDPEFFTKAQWPARQINPAALIGTDPGVLPGMWMELQRQAPPDPLEVARLQLERAQTGAHIQALRQQASAPKYVELAQDAQGAPTPNQSNLWALYPDGRREYVGPGQAGARLQVLNGQVAWDRQTERLVNLPQPPRAPAAPSYEYLTSGDGRVYAVNRHDPSDVRLMADVTPRTKQPSAAERRQAAFDQLVRKVRSRIIDELTPPGSDPPAEDELPAMTVSNFAQFLNDEELEEWNRLVAGQPARPIAPSSGPGSTPATQFEGGPQVRPEDEPAPEGSGMTPQNAEEVVVEDAPDGSRMIPVAPQGNVVTDREEAIAKLIQRMAAKGQAITREQAAKAVDAAKVQAPAANDPREAAIQGVMAKRGIDRQTAEALVRKYEQKMMEEGRQR